MGRKEKKDVPVASFRKDGHVFEFFVRDTGKVECCIDNGKLCAVKEIKDGKSFFVRRQELVIKGELVDIGEVEIPAEHFVAIKEAQDEIFEAKNGLSIEEHKETLHRVDSWDKKVKYYKDKNKVKRPYCIHSFRIGNDKYCFTERKLPDVGIVINPDYKVSPELPDVGGLPKQYGELVFWNYLFEDKGWQRIRTLTNNELICFNIIQKHGYFATGQDEAEKRKKGFLKR